MKYFQTNHIGDLSTRIITNAITTILQTDDFVTLALPGGRSAKTLCESLRNADIPWKKVHIFMVDERLVALEHPDSNFLIIKEALIDYLQEKIPVENIHPFIYTTDESEFGKQSYEDEILRHKGYFDIAVLSAGEDGHIAGLFPNHETIQDESLVLTHTKTSPKAPALRISASRKLLLQTKQCILIFSGSQKEDALRLFFDETKSPIQCPAKLPTYIEQSFLITDLPLPETIQKEDEQ